MIVLACQHIQSVLTTDRHQYFGNESDSGQGSAKP